MSAKFETAGGGGDIIWREISKIAFWLDKEKYIWPKMQKRGHFWLIIISYSQPESFPPNYKAQSDPWTRQSQVSPASRIQESCLTVSMDMYLNHKFIGISKRLSF